MIHVLLPSALAVILASSAQASYNFNPLTTFTLPNEFSCADVTFGPNGLLYGTTHGNNGFNVLYVTVFSYKPGSNADGSRGAFSTIYSFSNSGDGANPESALTLSADGTKLYGTPSNSVFSIGTTACSPPRPWRRSAGPAASAPTAA